MPGVREDWFPTSVWYFDVEDHAALDEQLLRAIRAERERDPAGMADRSSVLGWHSRDDLHLRDELKPFTDLVMRSVLEVAAFNRWNLDRVTPEIRNCWAIVNEKHASNTVHNHPRSMLSGVYYVRAPARSGNLFFLDPRTAPPMVAAPVTQYTPWTYERVVYEPVAGRMLLFPAWLMHGVEPNLSDEPRVCLSFNVSVSYRDGAADPPPGRGGPA
jgi:uncharacterized protein (TIGR02466 family)